MKTRTILRRILPGLTLYSLVFLRYLYYGFQYFYQLDDYIQYHNYAFFNQDLWGYIRDMGMLQSRPAAGAADVFVWSNFFPFMMVAVAILAALYTMAGLLLRSVFERHFKMSWLFAVIFALLPLGFEGTYWVSASSRVVCGLFFGAWGAWSFQRYLDHGRWYALLTALVLQFVGSCFYEQALVFSVALFALLGLLNLRQHRWKCLWAGFPVLNTGLYFLLTALAPAGKLYAGRMQWMLPNSAYYFKTFLPDLLGQIKSVFWDGNWQTVGKGFLRGAEIIIQDGAVWFALLLVGLCLAFGRSITVSQKSETAKGSLPLALAVGSLLAIAPLAPFFILGNPWFSFRGAVFSFPGLALVADVLFTALWCRWKKGWILSSAVTASIALVFCVAGISELHDYKQTTENDHRVADAIISQTDLSDSAQKIGLLGVEQSFLEDQNYFWHEHIHGVTESNWALSGLLQYKLKRKDLPTIVPLQAEEIYRAWNYEANRIDGFDLLYYYDYENNTFLLLQARQTGERSFDLYTEEGVLLGRVAEEGGQASLILE